MRNSTGTLIASALGITVVQLNAAVVTVAFGSLRRAFHVDVVDLQWVVNAYALSLAALLLSAGLLGDRYGPRRIFAAEFGLSALAAFAAACAADYPMLIGMRALQGVGAALLLPASLSLIDQTSPSPAARAHAIGIWSGAGSLALALGPVVGGLLVARAGWPTLFLSSIPLSLAGLWLTWRHAPHEGGARRAHLDWSGQLMAVLALASLGWSARSTAQGWLRVEVWIGAAISLMAAAAFVVVERRSSAPMVAPSLLGNSAFGAITVARALVNLAYYGLVFVFGLFFQTIQHRSALETGFMFLPTTAGLIVMTVVAGRLCARYGPRGPALAGIAFAIGGYFFLVGSLRTALPDGRLRRRAGRSFADDRMPGGRPTGGDRHRVGRAQCLGAGGLCVGRRRLCGDARERPPWRLRRRYARGGSDGRGGARPRPSPSRPVHEAGEDQPDWSVTMPDDAMLNPISILVLGAGELGMSVLRGLSRQAAAVGGASVSVLLRPSAIASSDPAKRADVDELTALAVEIVPGDLATSSVADLADLFRRFDTVVSCVGFASGPGAQLKLAQAVLAADVRRYVPWQFGVDYDVIGRGSAQDLFDEQLDVRDLLRAQHGTEWIIVSTGMFTSFLFEPSFGVVDLVRPAVRALGGWETEVTVTTPDDIGTLTAEVLFAEPRIANSVIYVAGDTISYARLAGIVEDFIGREVERSLWTMAELRAELASDPEDTLKKYRAVFAGGRGVAWDMSTTFNADRGMPTKDVATWAVDNLGTPGRTSDRLR